MNGNAYSSLFVNEKRNDRMFPDGRFWLAKSGGKKATKISVEMNIFGGRKLTVFPFKEENGYFLRVVGVDGNGTQV